MKIRNIAIIGLFVLLCTCTTVAAESISDGTDDVLHWSQTGTAWSWRANIADKPDIDITEISYSVNDNKLTLKLEVDGAIQDSEYYWYNAYFNTTDSVYMWWWSNGTGFGMASNQGQQAFDMIQNLTVSGDSISAEFNVLGETTNVELWGVAYHYTTIGDDKEAGEYWGDWAPNSKFTGDIIDDDTDGDTGDDTNGDDDGNGDTSKPSTPGFELLAVIAAVAVALILIRKRR